MAEIPETINTVKEFVDFCTPLERLIKGKKRTKTGYQCPCCDKLAKNILGFFDHWSTVHTPKESAMNFRAEVQVISNRQKALEKEKRKIEEKAKHEVVKKEVNKEQTENNGDEDGRTAVLNYDQPQ